MLQKRGRLSGSTVYKKPEISTQAEIMAYEGSEIKSNEDSAIQMAEKGIQDSEAATKDQHQALISQGEKSSFNPMECESQISQDVVIKGGEDLGKESQDDPLQGSMDIAELAELEGKTKSEKNKDVEQESQDDPLQGSMDWEGQLLEVTIEDGIININGRSATNVDSIAKVEAQEIELRPSLYIENVKSKREKSSAKETEGFRHSQGEINSVSKLGFGILSKFILLEIALMLFDTGSDLWIVKSLFEEEYILLPFIGLSIDILPGIVTALYMASDGHGWKSLLLLIHPWNVVWQCFWTFYSKTKKEAEFHKKIFMFAKSCQALLESPLQIIFTTTLIAHRILQLPWKRDLRIQLTDNSVDLSMLLSLSIIFSLLVIIKDFTQTAASIQVTNKGTLLMIQKYLTWGVYFASVILFRLEVWVLLLVYYGEMTTILIIFLIILNLVLIYFLHERKFTFGLVFDSLMSVVFPSAFTSMADIDRNDATKVKEGRLFMRHVYMTFGITGTVILCKSTLTEVQNCYLSTFYLFHFSGCFVATLLHTGVNTISVQHHHQS